MIFIVFLLLLCFLFVGQISGREYTTKPDNKFSALQTEQKDDVLSDGTICKWKPGGTFGDTEVMYCSYGCCHDNLYSNPCRDRLPPGAITAIVIGCILFVVGIVIVVSLYVTRRNRGRLTTVHTVSAPQPVRGATVMYINHPQRYPPQLHATVMYPAVPSNQNDTAVPPVPLKTHPAMQKGNNLC